MSIIEASGTANPVNAGTQINVQLVHKDAIMPSKAHLTDAGLDLCSVEEFTLAAGERRLVDTGVALTVPNNYVGMVCPRSGLAAKHGITIVNSPGIIDSGFRSSIKIIMLNTSDQPIEFFVGDRIAQLVVAPLLSYTLNEVEELSESDRGMNGFGSTGR